MSGEIPEPYRAPSPQPPSELERLARQGQDRYAQYASAGAQESDREGRDNLRVALGVAFGTPLWRAVALVHYALIALFVASFALTVTQTVPAAMTASVIGPAALSSFVLIFVRVFVAPRASDAQCEAEARWVSSLPFALRGYFEALRAQPDVASRFGVEITFANPSATVRVDLMMAAARAFDPGLADFYAMPGSMRWMTSAVSGSTGIRVNRRPVYRNHRMPPFVHALVEKTLLPMHREQTFAAVSLTRY